MPEFVTQEENYKISLPVVLNKCDYLVNYIKKTLLKGNERQKKVSTFF